MVWVLPEFMDNTIACASEVWISVKDGKIFCKWPRKDVEKKNRANAVPDNSKDWKLYECRRLLMNGGETFQFCVLTSVLIFLLFSEKFGTYESARAAELIAQDHSTMSKYVKSKSAKRTRKRTAKYSIESESKKIKSMAKADQKCMSDAVKKFTYIQKTSTPLQNTLNDTGKDGPILSRSNINELSSIVVDNISQSSSSDDDDLSEDGDAAVKNKSHSSAKISSPSNSNNNSSPSSGCSSSSSSNCSSNSSSESDSESSTTLTERNGTHLNNIEPSSALLSTPSENESRPRDMREELNEIKKDIRAISEVTNNNAVVLKELKDIGLSSIVVFKDLSAEVFKCNREIKKRNGLFTDLLHPDIEVPIQDEDHYEDVTEKLKDKRFVDNLVRLNNTI